MLVSKTKKEQQKKESDRFQKKNTTWSVKLHERIRSFSIKRIDWGKTGDNV